MKIRRRTISDKFSAYCSAYILAAPLQLEQENLSYVLYILYCIAL